MSKSVIIQLLVIYSTLGLLLGLILKLKINRIPNKILLYSMFVVLLETIIYPLAFPLFFRKKRHAEFKTNEIIRLLKENNSYNKNKINKKKLEKYIYDSLTIGTIFKFWINAIKNMVMNFDKNVIYTINKIIDSGMIEILNEIQENKAKIKENNKKINQYQKKIKHNKRRILVLNIRIKMKEVKALFKENMNVYTNQGIDIIRVLIRSSQLSLDNKKYKYLKNDLV